MRIAAGLRRRGVDVFTVVEAGLLGAPDEQHLEYAVELRRVLVTADPDFLRITHARSQAGLAFPGLIFILPATAVGAAIGAILRIVVLERSEIENQTRWIP